MENVFTKKPEKGDIVLGVLGTKEVVFIKLDTYDESKLNMFLYEKIGVVARRTGKEVLIVYKENASKTWCNRAWWYLSGFVLDGAEHTSTLVIRTAGTGWTANVEKDITYSATTETELVAQLNTAFQNEEDMNIQDWYADIQDGKIRLHCIYSDYRQLSSNTAKNGFTIGTALPEVKYLADIRRKHGGNGGEGVISNLARALVYFRADLTSASYNPTSVLTNIKTSYPVCLPAYLGESTNRDGDMCKILRDTYGEGEEGWLKYMNAQRPVVPTDWGNMGMRDGLARTKFLAEQKYTSNKVTTPSVMCAAADYCYQKGTVCIPQGNWYLPTIKDIFHIHDGLTYNTNPSRESDPINKGLLKIGGSAISNSSYLWSCLRYVSNYAWYSLGNYGFFFNGSMYYSYYCVPVSLYKIA